MSEEEYLTLNKSRQPRGKRLDPYEDFVRARLEECPDASTAQVHDWLKEHFEDLIDVNEKTVFNFVLALRNKYDIPKQFHYRGVSSKYKCRKMVNKNARFCALLISDL